MEGTAVLGSCLLGTLMGVLYLALGRGWSKWGMKMEPLMILRDDFMTACGMSLMTFEAARNHREHREPVETIFPKCGSTQGLLWCEFLQRAGSSVVQILFARARAHRCMCDGKRGGREC